MPRRGGSKPAMSSRPLRQPASNVPARADSKTPMNPPTGLQQQKQPGLFAQMATTAAGVAVGSAVGHTLGAAMMGGGGEQGVHQQEQQQFQPQSAYSNMQQNENSGPCFYQMKQFLDCAQNQYDITLCQGFNQALRECKISNGLSDQ